MRDQLDAEEQMLVKTAAFGAVFLVANADPGFFALIKESFAASDVIAATAGLVREALTTGDLPRLPAGSPAEVEAVVLPAVRRAVALLAERAPGELADFRAVVSDSAQRVAAASSGVSSAEAAVLVKVRAALGVRE